MQRPSRETSAPPNLASRAQSQAPATPQPAEQVDSEPLPGPDRLKDPASPKSEAPSVNVPPDPALLARFKAFHARLQAGMSRPDTLAALRDLKQQVHDLPPEVAAATVIAALQLGDDAATGLAFIVGDEGVLDESPTLRTALLDLLGQTEPEAAIAYSQTVLNDATTPDEYALALRNLGWLNHEGELSAELTRHFGAMLDNTEWRTRPTDGYLEAFDIAVAVGGKEMITDLVSVLRLSNGESTAQSAVNRAAFIALDRIMLREPDTLAAIYMQDPSFMDFAPNHRASLLSRLDPASAPQADALRNYLRAVPADSPELTYFARIYPNGNFFEGNRLVSGWETPGIVQIQQRDARALEFINQLLADPTYANVAPSLQKISKRLTSFAD